MRGGSSDRHTHAALGNDTSVSGTLPLLLGTTLRIVTRFKSTGWPRRQLDAAAAVSVFAVTPRKRGILTISSNLSLGLLHLLHEVGVSDNASSVPDFATRLIQTRDDPDDRALRDICQSGDLLKRLKDVVMSAGYLSPQAETRSPTMPLAHSYTTSIRPNFIVRNSEAATFRAVCTASTRSLIAIRLARPCSSFSGTFGSTSVFSWKTKQDSKATTSSGV
jgi:hypothetical protein